MWVLVTQVGLVYETVGAGRIASPTDKKIPGQKKSQCPIFMPTKFPKHFNDISGMLSIFNVLRNAFLSEVLIL